VVAVAIQAASLRGQIDAPRQLIDINAKMLDVLKKQYGSGRARASSSCRRCGRSRCLAECGSGRCGGFLPADAFQCLLKALADCLAVKVGQNFLAGHSLGFTAYGLLPFAGFRNGIKGFRLRFHKQARTD